MADKLKITQLAPADWKLFCSLRLQAIQEVPSGFADTLTETLRISEEEWRRRLTLPFGRVFIGKINNTVVGMLAVTFFEKTKLRHRAKLLSYFVLPTERGKGIGEQLMLHVLAWLQKRPTIVKVESSVNEGREASLRAHLKCGFKLIGKAHKEIRIGKKFYDQYQLEKILNKK